MKKFLLPLFVSCFAFNQAQAQITLNRADFGNFGDVLYYGYDSTMTSVSVGSGGPDKTWDFSTNTMADLWDSTVFADPTFIEGAPAEANMALQSSQETSFLFLDNNHVKLIIQLDEFGMDNQSVKICTFPFTYLSSLQDSAEAKAEGTPEDFGFSGAPYDSIRITIKIKTTSLADGWGSLKIGNETHNDVLRVRNETVVDVNPEGKLFGTWTPIPVEFDRVQKLYAWYSNGGKYSLAEAIMDSAGTNVELFRYQSPVFHPQVGLSKVSQNIIKSSYPNPAADMLTVELKTVYKENLLMQVSDITGKVVSSSTVEATSGITHATIDTRELPDGMYMVHFGGVHANSTARFVVKH